MRIKEIIKNLKTINIKNFRALMEDYRNINNQLDALYTEISNSENLTFFKMIILEKRNEQLSELSSINEQKYSDFDQNFKMNRKTRWGLLFCLIVFGAFISSLTGLYLYPVVSIPVWYSFFSISFLKQEIVNSKEEFQSLKTSNNILINNNKNFIEQKRNLHKENSNSNDLSKELLANQFIMSYIEGKELPIVSKAVFDYAVKILQFELGIESNDITLLLEALKSKTSEECLGYELSRMREKEEK